MATPDLNDRLVVDAIPAHIWRAAPDGAIQFVNKQWMDYTGLSQAESQGWAWASTNVIHPDDLPGLLDTWRRMLAAGEPNEGEARVRRVDGEYRWYLIRAVPVRDQSGTIVGWYGVNTDIEDRKRSETQYRQIIDAIPQLIAALSPAGKVLYANKSVMEYSGLSERDLGEENFRYQIFHAEDLERLKDERQRGLEKGCRSSWKCGRGITPGSIDGV